MSRIEAPDAPWVNEAGGMWRHPSGAIIRRYESGYGVPEPGRDWQALRGAHGWTGPVTLDVALLCALAAKEVEL